MAPRQALVHHLDADEDSSNASEIDGLDPLEDSHHSYHDDASKLLRSTRGAKAHGEVQWTGAGGRSSTRWKSLAPSRFCCMLSILFMVSLILLLSAGGIWVYKNAEPAYGQSEPWYPTPRGGSVQNWASSFEKAAKLVAQMTLVEKVNVTTGIGWSMGMCVGNTGPVDRLSFPSLCLQDGPLGLRFVDNATAFPAGITVGATWNRELMYDRGKAHGLEARLKGINVLLGPAMGPLGRLPAGGRNWEGFGSDPVLQGVAARLTIAGIQSSGVIATAKHYIGNEQEHFRQAWASGTPNALSSNIDDRTLHEIYAWPFAESVRAGVASVMCSYQQVNNSYASQNSKLLNGILKDELGFQGFVQSDWLAQRSGVASALAGLDMTMPGDGLVWQDGTSLWGGQLSRAVLNGSVPMSRLDDMTLRIVAAWYQLGQDDRTKWRNVTNSGSPNFSSWTDEEFGKLHTGSPSEQALERVNHFVSVRNTTEGGDHDILARRIAVEGIVLVKNDANVLPLRRDGSNISKVSSGDKVSIGIFGEDAFANPKGNNACPDRGCNEGTLAMGWGSGAVELPYLIAPADALHASFDKDLVAVTDVKDNGAANVESMAAEQDICIVFVNSDAGEGYLAYQGIRGDRNDLFPQKGGDKLVQRVAKSCGKKGNGQTVVVLHTVGPTILEEWIDLQGVKAVLIAHLPGQESGKALVEVLFGDVNPSGRLPYTIAKAEADYGPSSSILRLPNAIVPQQNFSEGLYIDYRYFDKHRIEPRYEFGYGLSYTTYELRSLSIEIESLRPGEPAPRPETLPPPDLKSQIPDKSTAFAPAGFRQLSKYIYPYISTTTSTNTKLHSNSLEYSPHKLSPAGGGEGGNPDLYTTAATVRATVANTGTIPGAVVVQLYISYPSVVTDADGLPMDMPVKVLRNFTKVDLGVHERDKQTRVELTLTRKDLSYWDVKRQNWILPEGQFTAWLGFSSRDLPLSGSIG